ncbi:hypothetical protein SUGI_0545560 [Cryptomeria japonica]|nr:hypothetical protein SUGI_0545560 [Cryptomeria japonica]
MGECSNPGVAFSGAMAAAATGKNENEENNNEQKCLRFLFSSAAEGNMRLKEEARGGHSNGGTPQEAIGKEFENVAMNDNENVAAKIVENPTD